MRIDELFRPVETLISLGQFREANDRLAAEKSRLTQHNRTLTVALAAELALELGPLDAALMLSRSLLEDERVPTQLRVRACKFASKAALSCGSVEDSERYLVLGGELCKKEKLDFEFATIKTSLLSHLIQTEPLETSLSFLTEVRRSVIKAGEPHLLVELHLRVAQCEARRRSSQQALRHFSAAERLLESYPNIALSAVLCLDKCNVLGLSGDLRGALTSAKRAGELSELSGQFRTRIGAAINACHLLTWLGDLDGARRALEIAFEDPQGNVHLRWGALDALANVQIESEQYADASETLYELRCITQTSGSSSHPFHWNALGVLYSSARLSQCMGRWSDAAALLAQGADTAAHCGDRAWLNKMNLARAMCLGRSNQPEFEVEDVVVAVSADPGGELELISLHWGALAAIEPSETLASQHLSRGLRVAEAIAHGALRRDLTMGHSADEIAALGTLAPSPNLDTAVALLELGPYTHVLGPEALAVVDGAGCARAAALIATGTQGPRVLDTRGWELHEALAALRKDGIETIPLGEYHDEAWSLVVDPKPDLDQRCTLIAIRKLIATALALDRYRRDEQQRAALWPAEALDADPGVIWASEQTAELLTIARRIAPTPLSVLLTGETGTGKEMLAHAIHRASDRADRVFLPFNCTAVPREMLDSQLFGYRKGAFTGAESSFAGVIRSAAGGTLFLDEIADVGLDVQPKLLRFLETHEIHPIGEPQPIVVDVRVLAATNADLERLVADGKFRDDLFYRLNVVRLKLPPLRERREEIPPLVQHYLERFGQEQKKGRLTISDEVLEYLLLYSWPGNVRQLANEMRRMVAMAEPGTPLTPALLSPEILASRRTIPAASGAGPELRIPLDQPLPAAIQSVEQSMIRHALTRAQGRLEEAAKLLGISRKGLFLKRRRWGLGHAADSAPTPRAPASPGDCAG